MPLDTNSSASWTLSPDITKSLWRRKIWRRHVYHRIRYISLLSHVFRFEKRRCHIPASCQQVVQASNWPEHRSLCRRHVGETREGRQTYSRHAETFAVLNEFHMKLNP